MNLEDKPVEAQEPVITDEMVSAYLEANKLYWTEDDKIEPPPGKWCNGTPKQATRFGLAAALKLYANAAPCARCAELEQKQSECIEFALYSDKRIKELQAKITEQDAFIKQIADTCTEAERIAIERAGRIDALESKCRKLRARLEKAERDAEYRLDTLKEVRETLEVANVTPNGPINDTIWYSNCETLFDFMDAAIAKERT